MRFAWLLLLCVIFHRGMSQTDVSFDMEGDSIWLNKIQLSSTVALHVNNAIVLMEEAPVLKKLREMRKAVKKQYQTELRKGENRQRRHGNPCRYQSLRRSASVP